MRSNCRLSRSSTQGQKQADVQGNARPDGAALGGQVAIPSKLIADDPTPQCLEGCEPLTVVDQGHNGQSSSVSKLDCEIGASGMPMTSKGASSQSTVPALVVARPRPGWEDTVVNLSERARTLEDVREAMRQAGPTESEKVSAFNSLERLCGTPLSSIPLDYEHIRKVMAGVNPIAHGLAVGTWINVRSRCNVAIKRIMSGCVASGGECLPMTVAWQTLQQHLGSTHERHTLSGMISWANARGVQPDEVKNSTFEDFDKHRGDSLRKDAARYRRGRVKIWNDLAARHPELGLAYITVHPVKRRCTQIRWKDLPETLRSEFDLYKNWAGASNPFDVDTREKALSADTLRQQQKWLLAAADTLVKSGVGIESLQTLRELVTPPRVQTVLSTRFVQAGNTFTSYNFQVARTLLQAARWLKLPEPELAQLTKIVLCQKAPPHRMAPKNKKTIRPYGSADLKERLVRLPERLFEEAGQDLGNRRSRLSKLQAAVAIGGLTLFAIRLGNLVDLSFDVNLDLNEHCPTLYIPEQDVKNRVPLEFDIPPHFAKLLREYRDDLFPKLTGFHPVKLFADFDGHRKGDQAIRELVKKYTRNYLGAQINPHAFRHLAANAILDHSPGAYPLIQDLLGHTNSRTTAEFYAGPNTQRAGRYHVKLLMSELEPPFAGER